MRSISRIFAVMFTGSFSFSMSLSFTDNNNKNNNKHPLEDKKSWNHHVSRQLKLVAGSDTISEVDHDDSAAATPPAPTPDDDLTPYTIKHKKPKQHIPFAGGDTTHGMMIDAGSVRMNSMQLLSVSLSVCLPVSFTISSSNSNDCCCILLVFLCFL